MSEQHDAHCCDYECWQLLHSSEYSDTIKNVLLKFWHQMDVQERAMSAEPDHRRTWLEWREHWMRNVPRCPLCNSEQVQLMDGYSARAQWRCRERECRHRFETFSVSSNGE